MFAGFFIDFGRAREGGARHAPGIPATEVPILYIKISQDKPNTPGIWLDFQQDIWPDIQLNIWPDIRPDIRLDIQPDIRPDIQPDIWPETLFEICMLKTRKSHVC